MIMKSIGNRIVNGYQRHGAWFAVGTVLLLGLLAYVPLMHKFGFYRDDWYMLWVGRAFGPQGIIDLFAFDRPFVGYIYSRSYQLLGENPLHWQIYSLCIRTIGALGFLWLLRRLWPGHKIETTTAAILFFIYPGFLQWPNANTKSNHLTTHTIAILSICLTVAAFQTRKIGWKMFFTLGALASAISYWFLYEYMIGLEGLRLAIIALFIWRGGYQSWKTNLIKVIKSWFPYLIGIALHLAWRFFVFESGREGMNVQTTLSVYQTAPLRMIIKRSFTLGIDVFEALISAWVVPINSITFQLGPTDLLLSGLLSLLAIGIFAAYFFAASNLSSDASISQDGQRELLEIIILGGAAVLFTLIPVVAVGRDIRWTSGFDKYTLQASAGVSMLLVGTISLLVRSRLKFILFALLIGIAIATHYGNAVQWSELWGDQRELWWQLSWRAPQLKEGTVLLVEMPDQRFYEDYEVWGPANLLYDPNGDSLRVRSEIFAPDTLEKIRVGQTENRSLRDILEFSRSYHNSLILTRPERTSCWHILDGNDPVFPQQTSAMLYATVRLSHIDQIEVNAPQSTPPVHIFGSEPEHRWCYYFQRASLEAQREDWDSVAQLTDQALEAGFKPIDRSEWLPFLKGLVMVGRNADAEQMALWIRDNGTVRHRQCDYLNETALPDPVRQTYLREILCEW
ncbi:MAG: hypothetical protein KAJ55_06275 [Anaerolineales bacterium]|nr:hypothetical protein [Anaerolineales bacterium]